MHLLFISHQLDQPFLKYVQKHIRNFRRKFGEKTVSKIESGHKYDQRDMDTKFCSDWLSGSYIILQTSEYMFINTTAVTLGQGHRKVMQYIFPDLYFLSPKHLSFSWNGFGVRNKSYCGGGRGSRNELKT